MMRKTLFLATAMASSGTFAAGVDIDWSSLANQNDFKAISGAISPMVAYRNVKSPRPMGSIVGVEASLDITMIDTATINDALAVASLNDLSSSIPLPKAHAHLSLPFGLGLSAYSMLAVDGASMQGGELQYAFIDGDIGFIAEATYTLAASVNHSVLTIDKFAEFTATGFDLKAAIGIDLPVIEANVYAGVGQVNFESTPDSSLSSLKSEDFSETKTFMGAEMSVGIFVAGIEIDKIGDLTTQSYKLGLGFGF